MKYLVIENKVELTPDAFLLMGASTKRNQAGQIGQFGTGAKYAVAVLLRERVGLLMVSGAKRYTFGTAKVTFREQEFERITYREGRKAWETTQYTTSMGPDWTLAGGVRELVSNAYDEENAEVFVSGEVMDRPGYTRIYVQYTEEVREVYSQFDRYFTFRRKPLTSGDSWAIYSSLGPGTRVYRRGVLVYENLDVQACFDYQNDELPVREDRTSDRYACEQGTAWILKKLALPQIEQVVKFLAGKDNTFEGNNNYIEWYNDSLGETIKQVLNGKVIVTKTQMDLFSAELAGGASIVLPDKWVSAFSKVEGIRDISVIISPQQLKGHKGVDVNDLTSNEFLKLTEALVFAGQAGIEIELSKVSVFETESESAPLGYALVHTGEIMLNRLVLARTLKEVVSVLFEEFVHNESESHDYTRDFQNCLIKNWVNSLDRFISVETREHESAA